MKNKELLLHDEIIKSMGECGHFLFYKTGGKYGRTRILTTLLEHGEILQCNLQSVLGISSGAMSEILAKIESDEYIEKKRSDTDGRQIVLKLTETGKLKAKQMQQDYEKKITYMLSCLTASQQKSLLDMLQTLLVHWHSMDDEDILQDSERIAVHGKKD